MRRAGWLLVALGVLVLVLQALTPEPALWLTGGGALVAFAGGIILADHPPREFERRGGYVYPARSSSSHYPESPTGKDPRP